MKRVEIILWIAAAVLAVTVTVVCLRQTPNKAADTDAYAAATLSLDEYGVVDFQLNLNTADRSQLFRLPDMTAEIAQNILDYRAHYGRFSDVQEIGDVKGVTETLCDRWLPYLTLGADKMESSR